LRAFRAAAGKEILRLHEKLSFTLLYVTHNDDEAFEIGTRVILMRDGQVARMSSPVEIRREIAAGAGEAPLFS